VLGSIVDLWEGEGIRESARGEVEREMRPATDVELGLLELVVVDFLDLDGL
jgi:hypothetical protein